MTEVYCRLDCIHRKNNTCTEDKILITKSGKCIKFKEEENAKDN